ncbi:tocopherol cyclase family protein [Clostridium sp.]|uniref:tocopherol cyclase family protein n=1 Tax=Clostridium sp. TaxID=1506 RepID=UPI003D6CAE4C
MNKSDLDSDRFMLKGALSKKGYDWWWHNFTGYNKETGEAKTFFIEYFVCNPDLGGNEPILGQLPENQAKHIKPSYALVKVGAWGKNAKQIHNFYSITDFSCSGYAMNVKMGQCTLSETYMKGKCAITAKEQLEHPEYMCDAGEMSWEIAINKKIAYNVGYGASEFFRDMNAFEMFWHAEGIKTEYQGAVVFDGVTYDIIPGKSYGYADKNWGSDFTSPWLWISSCNMQSLINGKILNNSAIGVGGGRPKVLGLSLGRKLLIGMYYEGEMYEYNFSEFWIKSKVDFEFCEGEKLNTWKVNASNKDSIMELTLECPKDEMLLINYESPSGQKLHNRLWNGGTGYGEIKLYQKQRKKMTLIDHIKIKNAGCEYGEY